MIKFQNTLKTPTSQLVNTKQPLDSPLSYAFCSTDPSPPPLIPPVTLSHSTPHPLVPPTPFLWVRQLTIIYRICDRHNIYMHKPYALNSGVKKKILKLIVGRRE